MIIHETEEMGCTPEDANLTGNYYVKLTGFAKMMKLPHMRWDPLNKNTFPKIAKK